VIHEETLDENFHQARYMKANHPLQQVSVACGLCLLFAPGVFSATFRWSTALNRIYVESGGPATLSDIKTALSNAPIDLVDAPNKIWLLRADVLIRDGSTLKLHGARQGGDVNELRLQSVNSASPCSCVVSITADYGTIDVDSTKITSWDTSVGAPDTDPVANGRAYVRVRSSLSTDGVTPWESRMDIRNSEVAYLGTDASESYGLVWKVAGATTNLAKLNVYGNVVSSHLHDNFIGGYTFGGSGMQWLTNEIDHNTQYGLDLQQDSDNLVLKGNNVHHNGSHGLLASVRCDHLNAEANIFLANAKSGIVLDGNSDDSTLVANRCLDNGESGIAINQSARNTVRANLLLRNQQAGLRLTLGSSDNFLQNNQCVSNSLYGIYGFLGSGTPGPDDDGHPKRNLFVGNLVHDNGVEPVRLADCDDNIFATNAFTDLSGKLRFQRGLRNSLQGNDIPGTLSVRTEGDANSPASTLVRNQGYLTVELGTNGATVFEDARGRIYQPDEGAIVTEISAGGSRLTLITAEIGSSTKVIARNFLATAAPGTAHLNQLVWAPATRTKWSVAAGSVGQTLSFTVGDLVAHKDYVVTKSNGALTNLNSGDSGQIHFADTARTMDPVTYSVEMPNTNQANVQYSAALNRIYLKSSGVLTLSDVKAALPDAPLDLVDAASKTWLLRAELLVQNGSTLRLRGARAGGDVNELRLLSLNTGATGIVVSVSADWGTIDVDSTKIISWDTTAGGPDANPQINGRAFLRVRSSLSSDGLTPQESRMDIRNSEIAYLGTDASESFGLVWKVSGATNIFDKVNVYGNVVNSRLHDNFIGAYTFGASGMQWLTNEVDHNMQYGLDLQQDSDNVVVRGNNFHHNGNHGLLASTRCDHLNAEGNRFLSNTKSGILLDDNSDDATVVANQCLDNGESGIAINQSARNTLRGNLLLRNQQAGLRLTMGSAQNMIQNNQCASNSLYGIYGFLGNGTPGPDDDGHPKQNLFVGNLVHHNGVEPIRLSDCDDNIFATNTFTDLSGKLRFQRGLRNWLQGNILPETVTVRTEGDASSTASTLVRNQAYLMVELGTNGSTILQDAAGRIYQPDEGAVLSEVSNGGSSLNLTPAGIGASTMVIARSLWASATPGKAFVHHLVWTNSSSKQWSVNAGLPGQILSFTIGDLLANSAYLVRKTGNPLTQVQSDGTGQMHFWDSIVATNQVVYSIERSSSNETQLFVGSVMGNQFVLTWTGGQLQHTTNLSPPNWQNVPTTNGQFSIRINLREPKEFFRTIAQ